MPFVTAGDGVRLSYRWAPRQTTSTGWPMTSSHCSAPDYISQQVAEYREYGWDKLIAAFVEEEGPIPEWIRQSIRETDVEHAIGFTESWPTWGWDEWESLSRIAAPTLILTGALEDPEELLRSGRSIRPPPAVIGIRLARRASARPERRRR